MKKRKNNRHRKISVSGIKSTAVKFKEWCDENERKLRLDGMSYTDKRRALTTGMLYNIFKRGDIIK